jgi:hypothetical protein
MTRLMGGWIALTPELDAKLLFGRHVWDCAQHADLWGRRLPELRSAAQQSEPANEAVAALLALVNTIEGAGETVERLTAIYRVLKPHLATAYERHLAVANPVYEPPTRRILARCVEEERRHAAAGALVLGRHIAADPEREVRARAWERRLLDALTEAGGVTGDVEAPLIVPPALMPDPAVVAQDIVTLPAAFNAHAILGELAAPLEAHRRALMGGDLRAIKAALVADIPAEVAAEYERLPAPIARVDVVGCARLGHHRVVKLRVHGGERVATLQERWVRAEGTWRIAFVETTSSSAPAP